jgi:ribosome-associated translation inhibitor RaiA
MKVTIFAKTELRTTLLLRHIHHRLDAAFGRVGSDLRRVEVRVEDLNGPRGGNDKRCTLAIQGGVLDGRAFEERDGNPFAAIHRLFDKARRAVVRASERRRDARRELARPTY